MELMPEESAPRKFPSLNVGPEVTQWRVAKNGRQRLGVQESLVNIYPG